MKCYRLVMVGMVTLYCVVPSSSFTGQRLRERWAQLPLSMRRLVALAVVSGSAYAFYRWWYQGKMRQEQQRREAAQRRLGILPLAAPGTAFQPAEHPNVRVKKAPRSVRFAEEVEEREFTRDLYEKAHMVYGIEALPESPKKQAMSEQSRQPVKKAASENGNGSEELLQAGDVDSLVQELDNRIIKALTDPTFLLVNYRSLMQQIVVHQNKLADVSYEQIPEFQKLHLDILSTELEKAFYDGAWVKGRAVVEALFAGRKVGLTQNNIVHMIWFLYAIAVHKGQPFTERTLKIQDRTGNLYRFLLDAVTPLKGYALTSSHYSQEKGMPTYCIYVDDLPQEKSHILFGKFTSDLNKGWFFVKIVNHGIATVYDEVIISDADVRLSIKELAGRESVLSKIG